MKKFFFLLAFTTAIFVFAQFPSDLKFDKNFVEAENHWVAIPSSTAKKGEVKFYYAFLYFDESGGGYSLQKVNTFKVENDIFVANEEDRTASFIQRFRNPNLLFAFFPENRSKELGLETPKDFLKNYNFIKDKNIALLERASAINGLGKSDLALPILKKLKFDNNNEKFYFELAYAYNALKMYDEAEKTINEAENYGIVNELIMKEKIYSLVNNNKLKEAEKYLETNFSKIKTPLYKAENIINIINHLYKNKDYKSVEKWIKFYEDKGIESQYSTYIEFYKDKLKTN